MEYNENVVEEFRNTVCVRSEKEREGFKSRIDLGKSIEDIVECVFTIVDDSTYTKQIKVLTGKEIDAKKFLSDYFSGYYEVSKLADNHEIPETQVAKGISALKSIIRDNDLHFIAMRNVCNLHQAVTIKYLKYFKEHLPEGEDYESKYTSSMSKILDWCKSNSVNPLGNISQIKENMQSWVSSKENTGESPFLSVNYVMYVLKEEGYKRVVDLCRLVVEEFADYRRPHRSSNIDVGISFGGYRCIHRSSNIHLWVGFGDYMYEELGIIIKGELV